MKEEEEDVSLCNLVYSDKEMKQQKFYALCLNK